MWAETKTKFLSSERNIKGKTVCAGEKCYRQAYGTSDSGLKCSYGKYMFIHCAVDLWSSDAHK